MPVEQRLLRAFLERHLDDVTASFVTACRETLGTIDLEQLATVVALQDTAGGRMRQVYAVARVQTLVGTFEINLAPIIKRMMVGAGEIMIPPFAESFGIPPIDLEVFRARAAEVARRIVAEQVTLVDKATKALIREIVATGFDDRLSPAEIARKISRTVGLDARRAKAFERFVLDLQLNPPDSIKTDKGLQRVIDREYWKKVRSRAATIGRTETSTAASEAQRLLWSQAIEEGHLNPSRYVAVWLRVAGAQKCPICGGLSGRRARLDGVFSHDGKTYRRPPAHPNCICALVLDEWRDGDELLEPSPQVAA